MTIYKFNQKTADGLTNHKIEIKTFKSFKNSLHSWIDFRVDGRAWNPTGYDTINNAKEDLKERAYNGEFLNWGEMKNVVYNINRYKQYRRF